jgi:hypothetical protein
MKCGKCKVNMRERPEERMGLKITVQECLRCGKSLISMDDAIRLQQRALLRIEDVRTVVSVGNSIGITLPAALKKILKKGDKVHLIWDMDAMDAKLAKA